MAVISFTKHRDWIKLTGDLTVSGSNVTLDTVTSNVSTSTVTNVSFHGEGTSITHVALVPSFKSFYAGKVYLSG